MDADAEREFNAAATDLRLALAAALGRLTPRQRAVVVLRYAEDLPESEVAAVLDVSVGTVRSTASGPDGWSLSARWPRRAGS